VDLVTQRLRCDLSYDGGGFAGWASQPALRTVQATVEEALARITRTEVPLTVAGRTDAGVHATAQVAHGDLPVPVWAALRDTLLRRVNGVLAPDVRLRAVTGVPDDFDARFSALSRRYEYRVADAPHGVEPLRRHDTLGWPRPLDAGLLAAAATGMVGEHDFAAYCRRRPGATTVRTLLDLSWRREPDGVLVATVRADAFCHSMVRGLIGALLAVGEGRRNVEWPASLLTARERSSAVTVVPPHGLALVGVEYPPPSAWAARAAQTRRRRSPVGPC
jgi:tRNA pseudouridine38-40 synthase